MKGYLGMADERFFRVVFVFSRSYLMILFLMFSVKKNYKNNAEIVS